MTPLSRWEKEPGLVVWKPGQFPSPARHGGWLSLCLFIRASLSSSVKWGKEWIHQHYLKCVPCHVSSLSCYFLSRQKGGMCSDKTGKQNVTDCFALGLPRVFKSSRIDAFELWCWRRLLRVPWTARRSNQSILKEISPGCSLEALMLKLKLQFFGHLMQRADYLKRPWCWKRLRAGGEGDDRGWDD